MTQQPVEANVVLTADTTGYDQSLNQSAANTESFGQSVDSLTQKLDNLSKSAGRKAIGFAAADVASITAGTAAYAAFERQMTSLSSQAAILNRTMDTQRSTFNNYANSVNLLRGTFGTSTNEAVQLVQTLSKMGDNTEDVDRLAASFTKLGNVTNESSAALAGQMLQLQRSMGTSQRETGKYNNELAVLAANSNASASSILGFAQQLAPVGRLVNMSQTDIMGISTAFQKAGQDGFQAANVFSKMMTDVAYASQTGSPDLQKYANLVGLTVGQFKELGGTDQFLRIFDSINRQGPAAITTLNRMGLDGMRTVRTVTAMAQQSGGLQEALSQARGADPGALGRGSAASQRTIVESLKQLRSELAMTGEAFGKHFAGPARLFIDQIEHVAGGVRELMQGPFGKLAATAAALAAPFTAAAGAIALSVKSLAAFSVINQAVRNSLTQGVTAGRTGYGRVGQAGAVLTERGQEIAAGGSWLQRGLFNLGQRVGSPFYNPDAVGPSLLSRGAGRTLQGAGALGGFGARFIGYQFTPGGLAGLQDVTARDRIFTSPTVGGSLSTGAAAVRTAVGPFAGFANRQTTSLMERMGLREAKGADASMMSVANIGRVGASDLGKHTDDFMQSIRGAASGMDEATKSSMSFSQGLRSGLSNLSRGLGSMGMNIASSAGGAALTIGRPAARLAQSAMYGLGFSPWMLGVGAAALGAYGIHQMNQPIGDYTARDRSGSLSPYLQAGGLTPIPGYTANRLTTSTTSLRGAYNVGFAESQATRGNYQLQNTQLRGLNEQQAMTMLAPQFEAIKDNPQAVQALSLDLTAQYGAGSAQRMLNTLRSGGGYRPGSFISAGLNQPAAGGLLHRLTGDESRTAVSRQFENLYGSYRDQLNLINQARGQQAAQEKQREQVGSTLRQFAAQAQRQGGANATSAGGRYSAFGAGAQSEAQAKGRDPNRTERVAFIKNTLEYMGVNTDRISDDDLADITIPTTARTNEEATRGLLSSIYSSGSRNLQAQVSSGLGVGPGYQGQAAASQAYRQLGGGGIKGLATTSALGRAYATGGGVGSLLRGTDVQAAFAHEGDVNAQLTAMNTLVRQLSDGNVVSSVERITEAMGKIRAQNAPDEYLYQFAAGVQGQAARQLNFAMPTMNRVGQFQAQAGMFRVAMGTPAGDAKQQELQQQAEDAFAQTAEQTRQYFVGLLTQQREFNISQNRAQHDFGLQRDRMDYQYNLGRERSEADFHQQQMWQLQDYQKSRSRAQTDFHIQRERQSEDFERSQRRQRDDYYLSRRRQEQDFNHQVRLMAEQTAKEYANIYERIAVQRTSSGGWLVGNAQEQLQQMQGQANNLDRLRAMGLSNAAIKQLDLTNPQNAQQLQRLVGDFTENPELIKQMNETIAKRLRAARRLTTDESSSQWEEFVRSYRLARNRAQQDFERSVGRARADFQRAQNRQEQDFGRSMSRMSKDFETANERARTQFHTSMSRAAEDYQTATEQMPTDFHTQMTRARRDLERQAETIDGNFEDILTKSTKRLGGHAREQAQAILKEFRGLKGDVGPVAIDLMETLGKIFGVDYKAPKLTGGVSSGGTTPTDRNNKFNTPGAAQGAVLPGYSPGQDIHVFHSATGGTIGLSGGESIMVPEWTRKMGGEKAIARMNHDARHGFAAGGVVNPDGRTYMDGEPVSRITKAQILLAENLARTNFHIMQGSWQPRTSYSGTSHMGPGVVDASPGNFGTQYWLRRVGFAAWGRNFPGAATAGSGAHVHAVSRLDPGARGHAQLSSFARGEDGLGGPDYGPNPPLLPGLLGRLAQFANLAISDGSKAAGSGLRLSDVLRDRYPKLERDVAAWAGAHIFQPGDVSSMMNRLARLAYNKMADRYGRPSGGGGLSIPGLVASGAGGDFTGGGSPAQNKVLGRRMALARGWGKFWPELETLWNIESGWNTTADNPTSSAYGIPQALIAGRDMPRGYYARKTGSGAGTHGWGGDPEVQIRWGLNYIAGRYGNPASALNFHRRSGWYGDGGIATGPSTVGVGERGAEAILPLDGRGVEFVAALLNKVSAGNDAKALNTYGHAQPTTVQNMHNYTIDRSTTFTGAITVQANDPNQMLSQLRSRARLSALSNAAKGGTKVA